MAPSVTTYSLPQSSFQSPTVARIRLLVIRWRAVWRCSSAASTVSRQRNFAPGLRDKTDPVPPDTLAYASIAESIVL